MRAIAGALRPSVVQVIGQSNLGPRLVSCRAATPALSPARHLNTVARAATPAAMEGRDTNMVLLGDTMLGRYVNDSFTWNGSRMQEVWGDTLPYIKETCHPESTITAANLECAVTDNPQENPKVLLLDSVKHGTRPYQCVVAPQAFNFKLSPSNIQALKTLGADFVSLANNHILDYHPEGLADSLVHLDAAGIAHAGAGPNAAAAAAPALVEKDGLRVAFVGFSDHYKEWAAGSRSPGINYINPECFDADALKRSMAAARRQTGAHLLVVFVHWGPNWRWRPDAGIRRLGRAFVDAGADLVFGHSAHHIQGVEVYNNRAIVYGAGGFIDDYALDKHYRNDLGALWIATITRPKPSQEAPAGPDSSHDAAAAAQPIAEAGTAAAGAAGAGPTAGVAAAAGGVPAASASSEGASADRVATSATTSTSGEGEAHISSLMVVPTHIRQVWRHNPVDAAPPGHGNPPYLSQVDLAHGSDYDWVESRLEELSADLGTKVEAMPNEGGMCIRLREPRA